MPRLPVLRSDRGGIGIRVSRGSPSRSERNDDLESLLVWGLSRFRLLPVVQPGRIYASVAVGYGKAPLGLVAAKPLLAVGRIDRPLTETVVGCDIVELSPMPGNIAPNFLCAKLIYKILSYRFGNEVSR